MLGAIENDAAVQEALSKAGPTSEGGANAQTAQETGPSEPAYESQDEPRRGVPWYKRLLTAKTGAGTLASYAKHPLAGDDSPSWRLRLVRGITGLIGDTDLAVADLVMAMVEAAASRRQDVPAPPVVPAAEVAGPWRGGVGGAGA